MKINIPDPVLVTFVATPFEKLLGPFSIVNVPRVGEEVRIVFADSLFGGEVVKVVWSIGDGQRIAADVHFKNRMIPETEQGEL